MQRFTKGAAAIIAALQKVEDERETIWSGPALMAILDLSPADSVLARALRSSVWDRTMREQFRAAMSGKRGADYLRPQRVSGFQLHSLLENAEGLRSAAGDPLIAERHLAMALAAMLRDDFQSQGIDWRRLGEEVTRMERGPEMERTEQALELERLRSAKARTQAERETEARSSAVQQEMARRGLMQSGVHISKVIEAHVDMLQTLALKRVELRRNTALAVAELGTAEQMDALEAEIEEMVDAQWTTLHVTVARWAGGVSAEAEVRRILDSGQYEETPLRIKSEIAREIGILKREVALGMQDETKANMVLNIKDSVVAGLNLGTVVGNIQTVVFSLQQAGDDELAKGLKELTEAVARTEELGNQRRDVIESLTAIGEQAVLPRDQQKPGVVKALLIAVAAALAHAANLAQIWQTVGPMIARHFGLQLP